MKLRSPLPLNIGVMELSALLGTAGYPVTSFWLSVPKLLAALYAATCACLVTVA